MTQKRSIGRPMTWTLVLGLIMLATAYTGCSLFFNSTTDVVVTNNSGATFTLGTATLNHGDQTHVTLKMTDDQRLQIMENDVVIGYLHLTSKDTGWKITSAYYLNIGDGDSGGLSITNPPQDNSQTNYMNATIEAP